jgi:hypothetical protein
VKITHDQDSPIYKNLNFLILIKITMKYIKLDMYAHIHRVQRGENGMASRGEMGSTGGMNLHKSGGRNQIVFFNENGLIHSGYKYKYIYIPTVQCNK